ncbi:hypothetical protein MHYP_G00058970 [Metynnis hypsauchen]
MIWLAQINKCTEDIVPKPDQKPWINAEVQAKLRAQAAAYNSGDPASYKKARYEIQRTIRLAKRSYRDRIESNYLGSDLRRMWSGLRTITDYKEGELSIFFCHVGLWLYRFLPTVPIICL